MAAIAESFTHSFPFLTLSHLWLQSPYSSSFPTQLSSFFLCHPMPPQTHPPILGI